MPDTAPCGNAKCPHSGIVASSGVQCDGCNNWFHISCARTTKRKLANIPQFFCTSCHQQPSNGFSGLSQMMTKMTVKEKGIDDQKKATELKELVDLPKIDVSANCFPPADKFGETNLNQFAAGVESFYEKVVFMKRNLFNLPSGNAGKLFIREVTFGLKPFNSSNSKYNSMAMKVLPGLLLQKPFQASKCKNHTEALSRRSEMWKRGDIKGLADEVYYIQKRLKTTQRNNSSKDQDRGFAKLLFQGKVKNALKLLEEDPSVGCLPFTETIEKELKQLHPTMAVPDRTALLFGLKETIPEVAYKSIKEDVVAKTAGRLNGSAGLSGLDAEVLKRMLCSKDNVQDGKMLREEISLMCFRLCTMHHCPGLFAPLTSCRLLALDKNPGVRPIGFGEVLRRLLGKCIVHAFKDPIKEAAGNLQTCAGFEAGAEAAIHAMKELYEEENSEAVIMIDSSNAFNSMNRAVALNNLQVLCPTIATYLINTYRQPSRLFVIGGELKSSEGTTQGDPLAMPWFSINTRRLINVLAEQTEVKQAWLADDATGCGSIANLWKWYGKLIEEGKKDGYFANKLKC